MVLSLQALDWAAEFKVNSKARAGLIEKIFVWNSNKISN
jgi:hypothetical protein